jgi:hypothetical protein
MTLYTADRAGILRRHTAEEPVKPCNCPCPVKYVQQLQNFQAHEDENRSIGRTDVQVEELCEIIGPECWHDDRLSAITK